MEHFDNFPESEIIADEVQKRKEAKKMAEAEASKTVIGRVTHAIKQKLGGRVCPHGVDPDWYDIVYEKCLELIEKAEGKKLVVSKTWTRALPVENDESIRLNQNASYSKGGREIVQRVVHAYMNPEYCSWTEASLTTFMVAHLYQDEEHTMV